MKLPSPGFLPKCVGWLRQIAWFGCAVQPLVANDLYWRTDGSTGQSWTGANWSNPASATGGTGWTSGANAIFTTNSSVAYVTNTPVGGIVISAGVNVEVSSAGTFSTGGKVISVDVGSGATFKTNSQDFSSASGTGFIKNGDGTWNIGSNTNAYTGGFTLNAGRMIVTGVKSFGGGSLTINGGVIESSGSKNFDVTSISIGGDFLLEGTGNDTWSAAVNLGGSVRTITQDASGDRTFSGIISNGGITKAGSGVLVLSNAGNNYTGRTTVSTGSLSLGNTGSIATSSEIAIASGAALNVSGISGWAVAAGQKLSGAGTVQGNVTVQGTHAVDGLQTVTGSLAYASGSVFEWSLNEASVSSGFDKVTVGGGFGTSVGSFRVFSDLDFSSTFWQVQQTWSSIFSVTGTATGWAADTAVPVFSAAGSARDVSGYGSFTISGTTLEWQPVPEPSSALAGLLIGAGLLRRNRKQR